MHNYIFFVGIRFSDTLTSYHSQPPLVFSRRRFRRTSLPLALSLPPFSSREFLLLFYITSTQDFDFYLRVYTNYLANCKKGFGGYERTLGISLKAEFDLSEVSKALLTCSCIQTGPNAVNSSFCTR